MQLIRRNTRSIPKPKTEGAYNDRNNKHATPASNQVECIPLTDNSCDAMSSSRRLFSDRMRTRNRRSSRRFFVRNNKILFFCSTEVPRASELLVSALAFISVTWPQIFAISLNSKLRVSRNSQQILRLRDNEGLLYCENCHISFCTINK